MRHNSKPYVLLHKISRLFQPVNIVPHNAVVKNEEITSKSQKLMIDLGIIRPAGLGFFNFLPLGERSLKKLIDLVDTEMSAIGAQKIMLPTITSAELWKKTGRLDTEELFTLKDRHEKKYVLNPTHEEAVTELIASISQLSYRQFPLLLYQISSKFRDEVKPRFGIIRSKEFLMKDLYTFDTSPEKAEHSYDLVNTAYENLFKKIGIPIIKVEGENGIMGGSRSHEYHIPAPVGENILLKCTNCNFAASKQLISQKHCPHCNPGDVEEITGIEVGHTFLLGTKYSDPLKATFQTAEDKRQPLYMGCYGLGLSRILAATIEHLSLPTEIRWPTCLAPFLVCIIPPKKGSKEEEISYFAHLLYDSVSSIEGFQNNVVLDDRTHLTIGRRVLDARKVGYPFTIVIGKGAVGSTPYFELFDISEAQPLNYSFNEILHYVESKINGTNAR